MAYTKVGPFVNDSSPYLNAANLNTMETGIDDAHTDIAALDSKLDGFVVVDADTTGASSAVTDFQTAVNATTDASVVTIFIPAGTYLGDLSSLTLGTRSVVWVHLGKVTFSTNEPVGSHVYTSYSGSSSYPWIRDGTGFGFGKSNTGVNSNPALRVQRDASHSGSVGANPSALQVKTNVADGVTNKEVGATIEIEVDATTQNESSSCFNTLAQRNVIGSTNLFGGTCVVQDNTTRSSTNSPGSTIGLEVDVIASGPDDAGVGRRFGLDIVCIEEDTSADGASTFRAGVRVRNTGSGVSAANTWQYAFEARADDTNGGINTGFYAKDCTNYGVYIEGTPTIHYYALADSGSVSTLRLGSLNQTAVNTSQIQFTGGNASAVTQITYGSILCTISDATASSEDGTMTINARMGGTNTAVAQFTGADATDPVKLYVGGSLAQVTAGANDSGGAGYKVLRIPN
jgi:hypothetical protein